MRAHARTVEGTNEREQLRFRSSATEPVDDETNAHGSISQQQHAESPGFPTFRCRHPLDNRPPRNQRFQQLLIGVTLTFEAEVLLHEAATVLP